MIPELHVTDWRRRTHALYAAVREIAATDPASAHAHWVAGRDDMLAHHPATPVLATDRPAFRGVPVGAYDPAMRFEVGIDPVPDDADGAARLDVPTGTDGVVPFERVGRVALDGLGSLDVWALRSYGGGLFVPVKDAGAGPRTYGGGRYLLDTVKGADLGPGARETLVLDLNFAYNPSCAYDPAWACPLAPPGNRLDVELACGELVAP
ncbi:hypothetical protein CLV28_2189 [Sediminihabitans luteus]|uniref:DUF1684 domain-containing protein n=1 Tax=Sediminihabitans luteus TaxID=1138585 RepID=A0A2M9CES6_9CELL|nr:DUF1684 domain-containing protein [Sediminihabitans luteus]PJJ70355.1 hypothetical protein CLV28_2189 [Sediminihabitans luteus]GII97827.1 hypothetical protein Slu03_02050 [Sediminihabitans luteus]